MENKTIHSIALIIFCILITFSRHFIDNKMIQAILALILAICLLLGFGKDMRKIDNIAIKGSVLSMIIVLILAILYNFNFISFDTTIFIGCISVSISIILLIIQWTVFIKNKFS